MRGVGLLQQAFDGFDGDESARVVLSEFFKFGRADFVGRINSTFYFKNEFRFCSSISSAIQPSRFHAPLKWQAKRVKKI